MFALRTEYEIEDIYSCHVNEYRAEENIHRIFRNSNMCLVVDWFPLQRRISSVYASNSLLHSALTQLQIASVKYAFMYANHLVRTNICPQSMKRPGVCGHIPHRNEESIRLAFAHICTQHLINANIRGCCHLLFPTFSPIVLFAMLLCERNNK